MTRTLTFFCIASLCASGLVSCELIDRGSGGTQVKHPTVDQMAELEKQWGVKPREARFRPPTPAGVDEAPIAAPPQSSATQAVTPEPVPLPPTAAPPAPQPPPQTATPAQIQKLKN